MLTTIDERVTSLEAANAALRTEVDTLKTAIATGGVTWRSWAQGFFGPLVTDIKPLLTAVVGFAVWWFTSKTNAKIETNHNATVEQIAIVKQQAEDNGKTTVAVAEKVEDVKMAAMGAAQKAEAASQKIEASEKNIVGLVGTVHSANVDATKAATDELKKEIARPRFQFPPAKPPE